MNYKKTTIILFITCILLAAVAVYGITGKMDADSRTSYLAHVANDLTSLAGIEGKVGDDHIHADFKVIMDGKTIDFMRSEFDDKNDFVHLHVDSSEGEGNPKEDGDKVVHIEGKKITIGEFFNTIGMKFTNNCFSADGKKYCNGGENKLMMFVNGPQNHELDNYEPKNHDRILITYGNYSEEQLQKQMDSVSNYSSRYG